MLKQISYYERIANKIYKIERQQQSPGTLYGMMSDKCPASWAFLAIECERRAYSSCSTRDTSNAAASLSAECPIDSLVENSATAGS